MARLPSGASSVTISARPSPQRTAIPSFPQRTISPSAPEQTSPAGSGRIAVSLTALPRKRADTLSAGVKPLYTQYSSAAGREKSSRPSALSSMGA